MKILVAEDSGFMRVAIERVLARAGRQVTTVATAGKRSRLLNRASLSSSYWT